MPGTDASETSAAGEEVKGVSIQEEQKRKRLEEMGWNVGRWLAERHMHY